MSFLYDNAAVIAVAAVASVLAWVFGGTDGGLLPGLVPWLFVLMLEVLYCFPQRRYGETTYDARERVAHDLRRDPVVWVALGLLGLLVIPFLNVGLCSSCDAAAIAQGATAEPPVPFIPFCRNSIDHLNVFLWFLAALPAMVVVRHALNGHGKRRVVELIVWNGMALAILGFVQEAADAPGPLWSTVSGLRGKPGDFFATFGYPNMAGDYFTTLFGLAVALWRDRYEQVRLELLEKQRAGTVSRQSSSFWRHNYFLIPAVIFFYAAINTLSRAAIILVTATAVIYFLHTLISFLARRRRAERVKVGVLSMLAFGLIVFFSVIFAPEAVQREVDTLGTTVVLDRVTGRGQYHSRVAFEVWKDNLLFGCGGWGYLHACIPKMTDEELKHLQTVGGINVHNDHLQFLAEHGLVGAGAMLALVVMLIWPIGVEWRYRARALRFAKGKNLPPRPINIFAAPAPVFIILCTALATLIHAFGDCPLRSPAVLTLFFISLAALPGFMFHKG